MGKGLQALFPASDHHSSTELLPGGGDGLGSGEFTTNDVPNMCLMDEKGSRPGGAQSVQGRTHQMLSGVITY